VTYDPANKQLTFGGTALTYDLNGNLTKATDPFGAATYTWDARNRLKAITAPSLAASFAYDALGRRTTKTLNGVSTSFVYDGANPVQEKAGASVTANILLGLGIDEYFTRTDSTGTRTILPDALGSSVALTDSTGTLQTQYTYEPFGNTSLAGAASGNPLQYTGRENDGTGLYYYRARYYSPKLQRFISEDPIGFAGGDVNLYAYVGNGPMNYIDPLGLFTIGDVFDSDVTIQGLAAFADGIIPFGDPFAANGMYNPCDARLAYNKGIGILTRDIEIILVPNAFLFGKGGLMNRGRWRMGWGTLEDAGQVFRVGGPGKNRHYLDWPANKVAAIGYASAAAAIAADLSLNGSTCKPSKSSQ
jgi:RHS repeat-associated protein